MNSLYGNFRTRKFTDIWQQENDFSYDYNNCGIPTTVTASNIQTLFYLLYAKYGNSHIASSDETQFKYKVFATIFQYGPAWEKRLEVQGKLRALTDDELQTAQKSKYTHAYNPSNVPVDEDFDYANEQNRNEHSRGKLDAYGTLLSLLETDVTEEFLSKFKKLFITIVEPERPLWYITEQEQGDDE